MIKIKTREEFVAAVESVYGPYENPYVRSLVLDWLDKNVRNFDLDLLWTNLYERFSERWGRTPGVADIIQDGGMFIASREELQIEWARKGYSSAGHPDVTKRISERAKREALGESEMPTLDEFLDAAGDE